MVHSGELESRNRFTISELIVWMVEDCLLRVAIYVVIGEINQIQMELVMLTAVNIKYQISTHRRP